MFYRQRQKEAEMYVVNKVLSNSLASGQQVSLSHFFLKELFIYIMY